MVTVISLVARARGLDWAIDFIKKPSLQVSENLFGFKTIDFGQNRKISLIAPYSPAWKAGLSIGDEIIAVNGYTLKNDFNEWMAYFQDLEIIVTISSAQCLKQVKLNKNEKGVTYFHSNKLKNTDLVDVYSDWISFNS